LDANSGYKTNRYPELSPELRAEIARRWGHVIQRYGYEGERPASAGWYAPHQPADAGRSPH
jgi:hypothetical protein